MCRFKSAIIFKNRVVLAPTYNDSHSDMLERLGTAFSVFSVTLMGLSEGCSVSGKSMSFISNIADNPLPNPLFSFAIFLSLSFDKFSC